MKFKINGLIELPDSYEVSEQGITSDGGVEMKNPIAELRKFSIDLDTEEVQFNVNYYSGEGQTKPTHERLFKFNVAFSEYPQIESALTGLLENRFKWIDIHNNAEKIIEND